MMSSSALRILLLCICDAAIGAQQQPAGLETDWDIGAVFQQISTHAGKMLPLLEKIDTRGWAQKGAPDAYLAQLQSSKDQARAVAEGAKNIARHPEQLSAALEIYFRIQGLETMTASLAEAIRKYQSPAAGQELTAFAAQNDENRDRLQKYLVNLAAEREHDLQVMDREAQRCRGVLTEPASKGGKKK